jgi:putative SOS response-associated peptidase YedK
MCGRYTISSSPAAIRALFRYAEQPNFPPRYNVAPTQPVPIVRLWEGQRQFALVRWGLIPPWVKDPRAFSVLFNARADSILEKPSFQNAMRRRRCLFPADGFFEWKANGAVRQPFAVLPRAGGPIAFAGVWETWTGPNGEELESAAIVTAPANATLRPLHNRMPVVIPTDAFEAWLDCARVDAKIAAGLLVPAPDDFFVAHEVSTAVNRAANDSADLLTPASAAGEPAASSGEAGPARITRRPSRKVVPEQGSLF